MEVPELRYANRLFYKTCGLSRSLRRTQIHKDAQRQREREREGAEGD